MVDDNEMLYPGWWRRYLTRAWIHNGSLWPRPPTAGYSHELMGKQIYSPDRDSEAIWEFLQDHYETTRPV